MTQKQPHTIGSAISGTDLPTFGAYAGLVLVIVGSIAPWATSPLFSDSGISGDGKWTAVLAVAGIIALARHRRIGAGIAAFLALALGVGEAIHIHRVLAKVVFNGQQLDHVGWGVYAVCVGALLTLGALYQGRSRGVGEMLRVWTRKDLP